MTETKADLPQGTLDLLILKVVALGPSHGYAIAQRLQQISRDVVQVPQGSLYPALHRLENRGLLAAEWKPSDTGREAKFYRLTAKGRVEMGTEEASWRRLTEAVGLILATAKGGASMSLWSRLVRRRRLEAQLDAELRDHVERQIADLVRDGDERARSAPPCPGVVRRPRSGQGVLPGRPRHALARRHRPGPRLWRPGAAP